MVFHSEAKKNCIENSFLTPNSILDTLLPMVEALELTNLEFKNIKTLNRLIYNVFKFNQGI